MTKSCRHCGRKVGHVIGCMRPRGVRASGCDRRKVATVEDAKEWFRRFGDRTDCISPTGRVMFSAILKALEAHSMSTRSPPA